MSTLVIAEFGVQLEARSCPDCGIIYAMPLAYREEREKDHQTWCCPNGHKRYFPGESELEKAERQRDEARQSRDLARERYENERRRRIAAKGQLTKVRNRIAAGVCPCCNRSFQDLGRHMKSQHPDYAEKP